MTNFVLQAAKKLPKEIRNMILDKDLISKAKNVFEYGTPMEVLFDAYEEFIDKSGEHDDYSCGQCRAFVLAEFHKMKPYLIELKEADV